MCIFSANLLPLCAAGGTFEEAVLAVHHVDASPLQAGGAVNLAVVLVEAPVRAAHRHEGGPTLLLADALGAAGFRHQNALPPPAAVRPAAGTPVRVGRGWKREREGKCFTQCPNKSLGVHSDGKETSSFVAESENEIIIHKIEVSVF